MRVYFEDGKLETPFDIIEPYHIVDAAYGPTACQEDLKWYLDHDPSCAIYTNYLGALSFDFSWDRENNKCDAYIRTPLGWWTNIQELTSHELRFAHNIPKMYMAGEF